MCRVVVMVVVAMVVVHPNRRLARCSSPTMTMVLLLVALGVLDTVVQANQSD